MESTTSLSTIDMEITIIDQNKIERLFNKRLKFIVHLDKVKLEQQKEVIYWLNKIMRIDQQILKAKDGKVVKKRLRK